MISAGHGLFQKLPQIAKLPDGVSDIAKGGLLRFGMSSQIGGHYEPVEFRQPGEPPPEPKPRASAQPISTPGQRSLYFEVFHDFLPNDDTWMELDPEIRDRWDQPAARIHLGLPDHHQKAGIYVAQRAFEIYDDIGAEDFGASIVGGTCAYLVHGTCRAGTDPETSVLDPYCRVHDVPNLFVVDGSFMPTSGGAPPTLTILANSFRVADHVVQGFRGGRFS